jgi:RNA polymerase-binding protein DksA
VAKTKTQPASRKKPAIVTKKKAAAASAPRRSPKSKGSAPSKSAAKRAPSVKAAKVVARAPVAKRKGSSSSSPKVAPIVKAVKSALRKGVKAATHAVDSVKTTMKNLVTTKPSPAVARSAVKGSPVKAGSNPSKLITPAAPSVKPSNGKSAKAAAAAQPSIIPPPPQHVPGAKPGKNQAGLTTKELEVFRDLLLQKRRELVGDMRSMESEALQRSGENLSNLPMHMADMGTDNYEQEFTLGLMEKDRQLLREINQALTKIMDGRYGICEGTGKVISKARLEVQPWAKYSIEHARKLENRGVR